MPFDCQDWILMKIENVVHVQGLGLPGMVMKTFGPRRYHGLVIQLNGGSRYVIDDRTTLVTAPGMILYLPKGRPYKVYCPQNDASSCQCVNFQLAEDPGLDGFLFLPRFFTPWQDHFSALLSAWNGNRLSRSARSLALVYQLLAMLEEQTAEQQLPIGRLNDVQRACAYLEAHLSESTLSIEDITRQSGMSPSYFRQQFRTVYGLAPKQYLTIRRIALAKNLLVSTADSVTEIAERSGFESLYHFSRAFKQSVGLSPQAYRNSTWI